jgi:Flp pilus assembly protein TadD
MTITTGIARIAQICLAAALVAGCASEDARKADAITETLTQAAVASEADGDYLGAANQYTTLIKRRPDSLEVTLGLARNLRYSGRAKEAARLLDDTQAKFADQTAFVFERGKAKLAAGDARIAIDLLTRARDLDGRNWEIHAALGVAYDLVESYDKAKAAYETARTLSKDDPVVLNNMAISVALSGKLDDAIRLLEGAPVAARHSPQIRQNLALFYGIKGDMEKAEGLAKMDLDEASVRNNMAVFSRFHAAQGGPSPAKK